MSYNCPGHIFNYGCYSLNGIHTKIIMCELRILLGELMIDFGTVLLTSEQSEEVPFFIVANRPT